MDRAAEFARAQGAAKGIEFLEAQNLLGIKGVRIAPQRLNLGHAEALRTQLDRRPRQRSFGWLRERGRLVDCPRKAQIIISAIPAAAPRGIAERRHALQESRRHHGRAIALAGTAQDHFAIAHRLREIMRGLAEFPFRRSKAQRSAHRAVEKRVGVRLGRPNRLVEAAEQHDIGIDQARLEKPEDLQARMRLLASAQDDLASHRREKKPVGFDVEGHAVRGILREFVEERVERLPVLAFDVDRPRG